MMRMSAKKQNSLVEAVRDAAIGYTAVVLGVICFLLTLVVVIAGVRFIVGINSATPAVNNQAAIANSFTEPGMV